MKVTTTNIEAARSQLREAIKLWFNDGDIASTHMLACSAHQIVSDINAAKDGRDLIYDSLVIKDEYRQEWINKVKKSYNHLKHAVKNPEPDHEIVLDTELTEFFIFFTCLGLELLRFPYGPIEKAFIIYFMVLHPELIKEGKEPFKGIPEESVVAAKNVSKSIFLSAFLTKGAKMGHV